jgi:hypothetical protein
LINIEEYSESGPIESFKDPRFLNNETSPHPLLKVKHKSISPQREIINEVSEEGISSVAPQSLKRRQ